MQEPMISIADIIPQMINIFVALVPLIIIGAVIGFFAKILSIPDEWPTIDHDHDTHKIFIYTPEPPRPHPPKPEYREINYLVCSYCSSLLDHEKYHIGGHCPNCTAPLTEDCKTKTIKEMIPFA